MKFTSAIAKEELLELYSQSIADAEKKIMTAVLGLGRNPDDFEMADLEEIEASLISSDVEGKDRVAVIRRLGDIIAMVNAKIAAL